MLHPSADPKLLGNSDWDKDDGWMGRRVDERKGGQMDGGIN